MQLAPSPRELLLQTYALVRRGPISDEDLCKQLQLTRPVVRGNLRLLHAYEMVYVSSWVGQGDIEYPLWSIPAYPGQKDVLGTHPTSLSRVLGLGRSDELPKSKKTSIPKKIAEAALRRKAERDATRAASTKELRAAAARRKAERRAAAVAAEAERVAERHRKQAARAARKAENAPEAVEARRQERLRTLVPPEMRKTQWAFPIDFGSRT